MTLWVTYLDLIRLVLTGGGGGVFSESSCKRQTVLLSRPDRLLSCLSTIIPERNCNSTLIPPVRQDELVVIHQPKITRPSCSTVLPNEKDYGG